jgi:hypothetical protein
MEASIKLEHFALENSFKFQYESVDFPAEFCVDLNCEMAGP